MPVSLSIDVDRSSPVPLYHQVAREIEAAIERGDLRPGGRLENEIDLAEGLGLSRPTMRRAIQELVGKGLLVRRRGVGTQVVQRRLERTVRLSSLYDDLVRSGQRPATQVLRNETVAADEHIAEQLGLPPGTGVVHLERIRLVNDEPLAVMTNWLPPPIGPLASAELEARGLYELIRGAGARISVASQHISATTAGAEQAKRLQVAKGVALLTMERVAFDDTGRAVEYGAHIYRADRYSFHLTLVDG